MKHVFEGTGSDDAGAVKEFGRYTSATFEYSSLVMYSCLQRGGNVLKTRVMQAAIPFRKGGEALHRGVVQVTAPTRKIGSAAGKLVAPFSWAADRIAAVGRRGFPVHLDRETLWSIEQGLKRIEERLARLEEKGIYLAGSAPLHEVRREEPDKGKNLLLRAILESTKEMMEEGDNK